MTCVPMLCISLHVIFVFVCHSPVEVHVCRLWKGWVGVCAPRSSFSTVSRITGTSR